MDLYLASRGLGYTWWQRGNVPTFLFSSYSELCSSGAGKEKEKEKNIITLALKMDTTNATNHTEGSPGNLEQPRGPEAQAITRESQGCHPASDGCQATPKPSSTASTTRQRGAGRT